MRAITIPEADRAATHNRSGMPGNPMTAIRARPPGPQEVDAASPMTRHAGPSLPSRPWQVDGGSRHAPRQNVASLRPSAAVRWRVSREAVSATQ
jgi:hypothetical protein